MVILARVRAIQTFFAGQDVEQVGILDEGLAQVVTVSEDSERVVNQKRMAREKLK